MPSQDYLGNDDLDLYMDQSYPNGYKNAYEAQMQGASHDRIYNNLSHGYMDDALTGNDLSTLLGWRDQQLHDRKMEFDKRFPIPKEEHPYYAQDLGNIYEGADLRQDTLDYQNGQIDKMFDDIEASRQQSNKIRNLFPDEVTPMQHQEKMERIKEMMEQSKADTSDRQNNISVEAAKQKAYFDQRLAEAKLMAALGNEQRAQQKFDQEMKDRKAAAQTKPGMETYQAYKSQMA